MEYTGENNIEIREQMIKIILNSKNFMMNEKLSYLDHFLQETTNGYKELTLDNQNKFKDEFLRVIDDFIIGQIYGFGWNQESVKYFFYDFVNEEIDEIEAMIDLFRK